MSAESDIISTITSSRKSSEDGSLVVYNLTKSLDFSDPRRVADALAKVFFEKDAANWFEVKGDHIGFNPKYKVRILLAEEHNKLLNETVHDFLEDLKEDEIKGKFTQQIKDLSANTERIQAAMASNAISAFLSKHFFGKADRAEVEDQILTEMLGVLEIRTPEDADLIDWENLPI